jgi:fructose-1,6-bisphosphatase II
VARAKGCEPADVTVCVLKRTRHEELLRDIRATGARTKLLSDGDVAGGILAALDDFPVDLLLGVGGRRRASSRPAPSRRSAGRSRPTAPARRRRTAQGHRTRPRPRSRSCTPMTWSTGDNTRFVATGITDGDLMRGVRYTESGARTRSNRVAIPGAARSVPWRAATRSPSFPTSA